MVNLQDYYQAASQMYTDEYRRTGMLIDYPSSMVYHLSKESEEQKREQAEKIHEMMRKLTREHNISIKIGDNNYVIGVDPASDL